MANLRWWLLLLAAVMFSMSGCASKEGWSRPANGLEGEEKIVTQAPTA
jgi:hypothetical protein